MANQARKKAAQREEAAGTKWDQALLVINAIYIFLRVLIGWSSFTQMTALGYLFLLGVSYACKKMLVQAAADASQGEYFLDVLVLALTVQLGTIYSDNFWYLFLFVPAYMMYCVGRRVLNYVFTPTAAEMQEEEEEENNPVMAKRKYGRR